MTWSVAPIFQRIVDRFIDVSRWPTAKKMVLVTAVALVFHVVVYPIVILGSAHCPDLIDVATLTRFLVGWTLALVPILGVSALITHWGYEGRWTVYLLPVVYGTAFFLMATFFGTVTTPLFAVTLLLVLFVTVFFDVQIGLFSVVYSWLFFIAYGWLETTGRVAYAPLLLQRTVDAQLAPAWYWTQLFLVAFVFLYVFLLVTVSVRARETQQRRLEEAHRELAEAKDILQRGNALIRRYVPSQLADRLLSTGHADDGYERRTITIFFSDVQGFTETADQLEAEDLSRLLNEYLSEMAVIAETHGGTVDKFVGDAVMILFGAPVGTTQKGDAIQAVRMALAMQARMQELAQKWWNEGIQAPFPVRMGINTGPASIGNFGSAGRMDYTAIGNQVNLAARVQAHCTAGSVLITHSTWALVRDYFDCHPTGDINVKGIHYAVKVYEVRGAVPRTASSAVS